MKKTNNFQVEYNAEFYPLHFRAFGIHPTEVLIGIFRNPKYQTLVFLIDLNKGTSVTNAAEQIATFVLNRHCLDPENTFWFECYPFNHNDIDKIFFTYDHGARKFHSPRWQRVKVSNSVIEQIRQTIKATALLSLN